MIVAIDTLAVAFALIGINNINWIAGTREAWAVSLPFLSGMVIFAALVFYLISDSQVEMIRNGAWSPGRKFVSFLLTCCAFLFFFFFGVASSFSEASVGAQLSSRVEASSIFAIVGCFSILSGRALFAWLIRADRNDGPILVMGEKAQAETLRVLLSGSSAMRREVLVWPEVSVCDALEAQTAIRDVIEKRRISEIVVAGGELDPGLKRQLLAHKFSGLPVTDCCSFFERIARRLEVDLIRDDWLVTCDGFHHRTESKAKRALDIGACLVLFIVTLPICVLVALAIRFESPGPILFTQDRIGRGGRPFKILKFRSMRVELDGPAWTQREDRRITLIGKWIRRFRIDEIPQIYNVLQGTMSLVGPRPEQPDLVAMLGEVIPHYHARHRVRPGITGWAQVNFTYGASVADAQMKLSYDLYYIKNFSILLDVLTLLKTIKVIFVPSSAR